MMHTTIGNVGHFLVISSFVASLLATYAYYRATGVPSIKKRGWLQYARVSFYFHGITVIGIIATLFYIIYNHYFEYHYAWSHASRHLPIYYMISCFWEGQEGSFLLWIFWHVLVGIILIRAHQAWEAPVMAVFMLVQSFLSSMILGVIIAHVKIGSSPFLLLREAMNDPIFQTDPNFVPQDGAGLNPLLQNYWMVIHPPTLFLGFALISVPFSFCVAGLWQQRYKAWIKPALPWALLAAMMLGLGIIMGAYWAYETLSFGGYWSWDPVENAVYVPWLVLVASIHTMMAVRRSNTGLKTTVILVIGTFLLTLYATFLTRSGVLGNTSVHSFTDLGLSGQLLIYLLTFAGMAVCLVSKAWKHLPTSKKELTAYAPEFWILIGATTLCMMGLQVLVPTSIAVYNALLKLLGISSNLAPPVDQEAFYTKYQLWFAVAVAIFSGTGQFFWWQRIDRSKLEKSLTGPLLITMLLAVVIIITMQVNKPTYIVLLIAGVYAFIANSKILIHLAKSNYKLSGGAIAHMGVAIMLMGILFSAGYSKVLSRNMTGLLYAKEFPDEVNNENVLLWLNEPLQMDNHELRYVGQCIEAKAFPSYIPKKLLQPTGDPYKVIAREAISYHDKVYFTKGDTLTIHPENAYYKIIYTEKKGKQFALYPRVQANPAMGLIASPTIHIQWNRDLYAYASDIHPKPAQERTWSELETFEVKLGETFFVNDYVAVLESIEKIDVVEEVGLAPHDIAVRANIKIAGKRGSYWAQPIYLIKDKMLGRIPFFVEDLGVKLSFLHIYPEKDTFALGVNTTQKDYIILKVMEKPWISLFWSGSMMLVIGFGIAVYRRYSELQK